MDAAEHCNELHEQVCALLKDEPVGMRVNVLLSSMLCVTHEIECEIWVPYLVTFLNVLALRNGLIVGTGGVGDHAGDEAGHETMH